MEGAAHDFEAGAIIAERYRVEAAIGRGGYGSVYRVTSLQGGEQLALKALHSRLQHREVEIKRFQRETALVARLQHPNVVRTIDYGHTSDGMPFSVFELLRGNSLKYSLRQEGPQGLNRAAEILLSVLRALEVAHGLGVVHRDIKPANIFLCSHAEPHERVKVLDFGIAKALGGEQHADYTSLTATGQMLGTPHYMAPEQVRGASNIDARADLYAVGLVLAEAISGRRVVESESDIDLFMRHVGPGEHDIDPRLRSCPFGALIEHAIRKDPAMRYQSATAMRQQLESILAHLPPVSQQGPFAVRGRGTFDTGRPPSSGSSHAQWVHSYPAHTPTQSGPTTTATSGGSTHDGYSQVGHSHGHSQGGTSPVGQAAAGSTRWGIVAAVLVAAVVVIAAVVGVLVVGIDKLSPPTQRQIERVPLTTLTPRHLKKQLAGLGFRIQTGGLHSSKSGWGTTATYPFVDASGTKGGMVALMIYETLPSADLAATSLKDQGYALIQRHNYVITAMYGDKKSSMRLLRKLVH